MSFDAIRWALAQALAPASAKFLLVAMADCVNADSGGLDVWPSYAFLARRTGMNTKTVEAGISRLKQKHFIVDTGKRAGDTGKVVVYRLNDPNNGGVTPGPHDPSANGTRPETTPKSVALPPVVIPPNLESNPPKLGGQSPQKVDEIPPNLGCRTRKGTRNRTRKEPGEGADAPTVPGVPDQLLSDWMKVRKEKKAGPLSQPAIDCLTREAGKAGLSNEDAVRYCCEAAWQNFNAGFYAKREGKQPSRPTNGHAEPAWSTEQRKRTQQAAPGVAVKDPAEFFLEVEARDVTPN